MGEARKPYSKPIVYTPDKDLVAFMKRILQIQKDEKDSVLRGTTNMVTCADSRITILTNKYSLLWLT